MIKNSNHSVAEIELGHESSREMNREVNQYIDDENRVVGENFCPHCQIMMIRLGSCFSCPRCGYGGCG